MCHTDRYRKGITVILLNERLHLCDTHYVSKCDKFRKVSQNIREQCIYLYYYYYIHLYDIFYLLYIWDRVGTYHDVMTLRCGG